MSAMQRTKVIHELVLPWPSRDLHPNARVHWARKAKATKSARQDAHFAALHCGWMDLRFPEEVRLHLWIDFYPPDRRRRDDDGLLASMKAARDGIADALNVDDRRFVSHPWIKDEVRKPGQVRIRVTASPSKTEE